ncbi:uncharacterized protein LOC119067017 isoform X2 [Bradysia coprophila]|uniref:uncharacterized protein LOC119067017 isoform X2 n=1 Tax=Bradysia coprophila TaxID=38358 RepID=UPI00187DA663|nr:uncharacterized protein LOC119067017 isoform X2 [Bradysia coprophila]
MHRKDSVVSARFCEGGHRCSPPKECCPQGCCYLYAPPSAPRTTPPSTDHVLNLFFINHWYFWCVVLALILAILCACSLWKKRRQLCGWGSPGPHSQSGDSAGSCYAPPQYSRCSSFHHAPPPYTEVTSKPDLYPLVFTCNGDNSKNGSSYLMVQYFRNYIVRPVGSLSATSTVDSLSSSCICIANEANTLVPPPYSRAASPDLSLTTRSYGIPRSASQQGCSLENYTYQSVPVFSNDDLSTTSASNIALRASESATIHTDNGVNANTMHLSRSDQQFKQTMITHSISNISIPVTGVDVATISQAINTQNTNSNNSTNSYSSMNAIYNIQQQLPCDSFSEESPINGDILQKFNDMRRYVNSNSGSAISSLNNVGTPDSPPRATSPTDEVKELLQQIRQLQKENSDDRIEDPSPSSAASAPKTTRTTASIRPSSLHRKDFFAKKVRYVSITNAGGAKTIRSPLGSGCSSLLGKGRSRKGWISKSAPTTPATALPPCFLDDDSQSLLNEQDEDVETN